jgi:hypothetical protein
VADDNTGSVNIASHEQSILGRFWHNGPSGVQTLTGRRRLQPRQVSRLAGW